MKMFNIYLAVLFAVLHVAWFDVCPDILCKLQDPLQLILNAFATGCATDNGVLVQYWIYNQTGGGTQIICPNDIDNTKPVKILIHGWAGNKNIPYIQVIKDAYIQQNATRYNIIIVDYGMYTPDGSLLTYATAYCNVPVVAISVANFICQLHTTRGVKAKDIHIVGHSLGAHIGGIAGDLVKTKCDIVIGRITGLDPAGPGFLCILCNVKRLDKTNAVFVDVIHTNAAGYGTLLPFGHVDFYVNGGSVQPGCIGDLAIADIIANFLNIVLVPEFKSRSPTFSEDSGKHSGESFHGPFYKETLLTTVRLQRKSGESLGIIVAPGIWGWVISATFTILLGLWINL